MFLSKGFPLLGNPALSSDPVTLLCASTLISHVFGASGSPLVTRKLHHIW